MIIHRPHRGGLTESMAEARDGLYLVSVTAALPL